MNCYEPLLAIFSVAFVARRTFHSAVIHSAAYAPFNGGQVLFYEYVVAPALNLVVNGFAFLDGRVHSALQRHSLFSVGNDFVYLPNHRFAKPNILVTDIEFSTAVHCVGDAGCRNLVVFGGNGNAVIDSKKFSIKAVLVNFRLILVRHSRYFWLCQCQSYPKQIL